MKFRVTKTLKFGRGENAIFYAGKVYDTADLDEAIAEQVIASVGEGVERVSTPESENVKPVEVLIRTAKPAKLTGKKLSTKKALKKKE